MIRAIYLVLFFSIISFAQQLPESGTGLSASYQENHFDIQIPIWFSPTFTLAPTLGFIKTGGGGSDFQIGVIPRVYFKKEKLSPFVGGRFAALVYSPKEGDSITDYLIGFSAGGEYFVDKNFSFGIEAQLNLSMSDDNSFRYSNPGETNINTATALFATLYFN
jgi:hypothetical protein